jgi:hypothetical protein
MLCLISALASALFGAPKQKFPVEIFVELNHASPLVLLELDPARPVTAETKTLRGLPVVNVMNIRIRQMREGMAEDVRDSVVDSREDPADCFVPHYAIHAWTGKVNLDLFFSFQCRRLVCYVSRRKVNLVAAIFRKIRPVLCKYAYIGRRPDLFPGAGAEFGERKRQHRVAIERMHDVGNVPIAASARIFVLSGVDPHIDWRFHDYEDSFAGVVRVQQFTLPLLDFFLELK